MFKIGAVLKKVRMGQDKTLKDIVDKMEGYDATSLSRLERGIQGATQERLTEICNILGVSLGDVYNELDKMNGIEKKPLSLGDALGDDPKSTKFYIEVPYFDRLTLPTGETMSQTKLKDQKETTDLIGSTLADLGIQKENVFCTKVHDDSMSPVIPPGSLIAVNIADDTVINGKTYVVNHLGMIRIAVLYGLPGGGYRLKFHNTEGYPEEKCLETDEIKIVGRVFWYAASL